MNEKMRLEKSIDSLVALLYYVFDTFLARLKNVQINQFLTRIYQFIHLFNLLFTEFQKKTKNIDYVSKSFSLHIVSRMNGFVLY